MDFSAHRTPTHRTTGRRLQRARVLFFRQHPLCARCLKAGRFVAAVELDHIVPVIFGGPDTTDNKQGLCTLCHRIKTAEDFRKQSHALEGCDASGTPLDASHHWNQR
jgi:5-methylcytosine-specific restriction protein A